MRLNFFAAFFAVILNTIASLTGVQALPKGNNFRLRLASASWPRPHPNVETAANVKSSSRNENHLTPRERLELLVPVCQAIQHAHQKGIIHRDIKPSNVMVTVNDERPVPKVIDFGVAKAIEQQLTEQTLFTQFGMIVGTLEYMSPE